MDYFFDQQSDLKKVRMINYNDPVLGAVEGDGDGAINQSLDALVARDEVINAKLNELAEKASSLKKWKANEPYAVDDIVIYDNKIYLCTTQNSDATFNINNWVSLGVGEEEILDLTVHSNYWKIVDDNTIVPKDLDELTSSDTGVPEETIRDIVATKVSEHESSVTSHSDIREEIATITSELSEKVNKSDLPNYIFSKQNIVYGFRLNETESDPSSCITYLADAVGMTPVFMNYNTGIFDYGSWQNAFFMPKPCMLKYDGTVDYYLDPNNYAFKEDGITPSDVTNDEYEGNAMMEWGQNGRKIYYKFVPVRDKVTDIFIANYKADDNFVCPNFINSQGNEVDHFYTAIYNGSNISGRLRSLSGKTHMVGQSGTTEIAYAQANGDGWYIEQYSDRQLITILLMLMGKSLDSQKIYGSGHNSGGSGAGSNLATGLMDRKGLFWGSNGNTGVKVFGIENFWGEVNRRCAGLLSVDYKAKVKMYPPYNFSGDGYVEAGSLPTANNSYITSMSFENNIMIPKAVSGSSTTYYCDIYYVASGTNYLLASGYSADGAECGFCFFSLNAPVSYGSWYVGASTSYR